MPDGRIRLLFGKKKTPLYPTDGLIAEYMFADYNDTSGSGYHLTNHSGITLGNDGPTGIVKSSYNSGSGYLQANNTVIPSNGIFTISCWYKEVNHNNEGMVFGTTAGKATAGFYMDILGNKVYLYINRKANTSYNSYNVTTTKFQDGNWHYITYGTDGSTVRFYIDNVLTWSQTVSCVVQGTQGYNLCVGNGYNTSTRQYAYKTIGYMAAFRVYNRYLTDNERAMLYNGGQGV